MPEDMFPIYSKMSVFLLDQFLNSSHFQKCSKFLSVWFGLYFTNSD